MTEVVTRLLKAEGKVRTLEMADGSTVERKDGSVSWRNNNPGNLKFEYAGSADASANSRRTREKALADAQNAYGGVVGLDQWGNAVFETYEAGRAAKIQLLERKHGAKTVEQLLPDYSRPDYSGGTHHGAQAAHIFREGDRQGVDLRGKTVSAMTTDEKSALADGIKGFEGWSVGQTRVVNAATRTSARPRVPASREDIVSGEYPGGDLVEREVKPVLHRAGSLAHAEAASANTVRGEADTSPSVPAGPLKSGSAGPDVHALQVRLIRLGFRDAEGNALIADGKFGTRTEHALRTFQREQGIEENGVVGSRVRVSLERAEQRLDQLNVARASGMLARGMSGPDIESLQTTLNELGYRDDRGAALKVDGSFGANTAAAVRNFQNAHGLNVDGVMGPATRHQLTASAKEHARAVEQTAAGDIDGAVWHFQQDAPQQSKPEPGIGAISCRPFNDVLSHLESLASGNENVFRSLMDAERERSLAEAFEHRVWGIEQSQRHSATSAPEPQAPETDAMPEPEQAVRRGRSL